MLEKTIINGRHATVAYLNRDMSPATKDKHQLVKVIFDDGEIVFLTPAPDKAS